MRLRTWISRCAWLPIAAAAISQARAETPVNGTLASPPFVPVVWKPYDSVTVQDVGPAELPSFAAPAAPPRPEAPAFAKPALAPAVDTPNPAAALGAPTVESSISSSTSSEDPLAVVPVPPVPAPPVPTPPVPAPAAPTPSNTAPTSGPSLLDEVGESLSYLRGGSFSKDSNFWASGEYMFAWLRSAGLPPLVTTSPAGTPRATAGVLGTTGTSTLFGGNVDGNIRPGFRVGAGYWCTDDHTLGIEAAFMMLGTQSALFSAGSNGAPILARPYIDATTNTPQAVLVAFPGSSTGSVSARAATNEFFAGNLDVAEKVLDSGAFRLIALGGYRAFGYSEDLTMEQHLFPTNPNFVAGTQIASADHFRTKNIFHGMDLGFRGEFFWSSFSLELLAKAAVGNLRTVVAIDRAQATSVPGSPPVIVPGGVYALRTNSASFSNNYFDFVPEGGAALKWQIVPELQLRLGYSLILLDGIARAGDQVNSRITPANFPPPTGAPSGQPTFLLNRANIWMQSINIGLTFTY